MELAEWKDPSPRLELGGESGLPWVDFHTETAFVFLLLKLVIQRMLSWFSWVNIRGSWVKGL